MIDGGLQRARQQTGKSAADFIDWKFHKDYLTFDEQRDPAKNKLRLDAMIATHADADHCGGLRDLIDAHAEIEAAALRLIPEPDAALGADHSRPNRGGVVLDAADGDQPLDAPARRRYVPF